MLPVALTLGDPAGIGPEITEKAWKVLRNEIPFFVIGDQRCFSNDIPKLLIEDPKQALTQTANHLPVLHRDLPKTPVPGLPALENSPSVVEFIETAVDLVKSNQASSICTNPINKDQLIKGADFPHPGHTEFLAHLAGKKNVVMMLASDELKVVPATIHIPLSQVPRDLTQEKLQSCIEITADAMRERFGVTDPVIAVAGLNPHAGENGRMGFEDIEVIKPVIETLRKKGLNIKGPLSADTMFHAEARAGYDVAIAMYHDQALIPIKTLAFDEGVNVTLGLPFVRTSPDHGTAYDIAGSGKANASSFVAALKMAWEMKVCELEKHE